MHAERFDPLINFVFCSFYFSNRLSSQKRKWRINDQDVPINITTKIHWWHIYIYIYIYECMVGIMLNHSIIISKA